MKTVVLALLLLVPAHPPSRAADKECKWEKISDATLGLEAWVERCNYGGRKIDFVVKGNSLMQRYSDGGQPDPVIDVIDLLPNETTAAGLRRIFDARTDRKTAKRCVLAPYKEETKPPAGVKHFTFVPDAAYAKELKKKEVPGDLPDNACGDFGDTADSIQYFETQEGSRKVLFVRVGQDIPLFDERTLRLLK
jgi:hypothetical protein